MKKLVQEHNLESEDKDFTKLKTKGKIGNIVMPPSQYYIPESSSDPTLIFESRFESGNLLVAIKISENEYDLVLQNDINTSTWTEITYSLGVVPPGAAAAFIEFSQSIGPIGVGPAGEDWFEGLVLIDDLSLRE